MVTKDVFEKIYSCEQHIKKRLTDNSGVVYNLKFPNFKWIFKERSGCYSPIIFFCRTVKINKNCSSKKFLCISGPRRPTVRSQLFPEDNCNNDLLAEMFPEDNSSSEDEVQVKKICEYQGLKVCKCNRPSSPIEISSDKELEKSMLQMEYKISLEMSDTE